MSSGMVKIVRKFKLGEEPKDAVYWRTRPPAERLAEVERIRREYHGYDENTEPRLERTVRVIRMHETS